MKAKKIGIFWENFEYGGVEKYLITLINNKEFKNDKFTIFTNSSNRAIINFKKSIKKKNTLNIIFYNSINQILIESFYLKVFFFFI